MSFSSRMRADRGVDWNKALPTYFLCLSTTAQPDEYASQVVAIVDEFERLARDHHLAIAKQIGTRSHREALQFLHGPARPKLH